MLYWRTGMSGQTIACLEEGVPLRMNLVTIVVLV